jgi:hypothetical protein
MSPTFSAFTMAIYEQGECLGPFNGFLKLVRPLNQ